MHTPSTQAKHILESAKKIALFWHMSPDGDCIGAMLGLGRLLEKQGKKVKYFVPNTPSKIFNFLKWIKRLKSNFDYKSYDVLVFVDFTWLDRIGVLYQANPNYFEEKQLLVFDHHIGDNLKNAVFVKDVASTSTCEILFELTYKWRADKYDKDIATYFYLWLTTDSGNFLFDENHERIFTNALNLIKLWANKKMIIYNVMRKRSLNAIRFLQLLLNRIKQIGDLLYTYYDDEEMKEYNIDQEEASYGLHVIQNIDGPKVVVLLRKIGEVIRGSLRAKKIESKSSNDERIDCNAIAKKMWWGWHVGAAGFSVAAKWSFEHQIKEIVEYINTQTQKK